MHIHILGICGTFMGGLAILARAMGHRVTGSDTNVYPPMSTQLEAEGIELMQGYDPAHLQPAPDLVVIGNAMSRGNPAVEYVLNQGLRYTSGPQWLSEYVLQGKWVLAAAGTHGKTTTSSMLAWILEANGYQPGFLIGGVPRNFGISARLGGSDFFVIEADEYDSAFFDKRSKFIHYRPRTAILNNLEFDHADIFSSLADIQKQFHHLVRTIPSNGQVIVPADDENLAEVLTKGCWSELQKYSIDDNAANAQWLVKNIVDGGAQFEVFYRPQPDSDITSAGVVKWNLTGEHNIRNAIAAIMAARHVGVDPANAVEELARFETPKRRMELLGTPKGISVYDDFAHHPTAIATTLQGLRAKVGKKKIIAVIEPRSNTMRMGAHRDQLAPSTLAADQVIWYQPEGLDWNLDDVLAQSPVPAQVYHSIEAIIADLVINTKQDDQIVIMSNGGFAGIHQKLLAALNQ
jgi:UDP-N-acetylmuramate: L-alanyl-gamma-D-glutamyl-meso-diaminopimelate ligase